MLPPPYLDYVLFGEPEVWEDTGAFPTLDGMGHWHESMEQAAAPDEYYATPYLAGTTHPVYAGMW